MKPTAVFFFKHYLFWGFVFLVFRALLLFVVSPMPGDTSMLDSLQVFTAGYRLDWSTASYFAVFPFFMLVVMAFGLDRLVSVLMRVYYQVVICCAVIICLSNILIFKHWGTLLNSRALAFATQPGEMFASVTNWQLAGIVLFIGVTCYFLIRWFTRRVFPVVSRISGTPVKRLVALVPWLIFIGIGIRGGVQLIPINESSAAFSTNRMLNQAAINGIWYLAHNLEQTGLKETNPYKWMDPKQAQRLTSQLLNPGKTDSTNIEIIADGGNPNVVVIILESWTADIIEPLGGIPGITSEFTKLSQQGLLFTKIYSSGFRTDQALTSVLSGFPAQPNKSIIRFPDKTAKLPSLAKVFSKKGYSNSFYYGGETGFANMNTYLKESGFSSIVDIGNFPRDERNSKWGVHDGFVFDRLANDQKKAKEPFFNVMLTLSTHEPFEVPVTTPFNGSDEPELFKKAAWYTDKCLGKYFSEVSREPWFQHTIFILVADHGHRLPKNRDYFDPDIRRIPLLVISPMLLPEYRGSTLPMVGGQHDLPATLLSMLDFPHQDFVWSNNLLSQNRNHFAYLSFDNAFIWLKDTSGFLVPLEPGFPGFGKNPPRQVTAKAYLQQLYEQFLSN